MIELCFKWINYGFSTFGRNSLKHVRLWKIENEQLYTIVNC